MSWQDLNYNFVISEWSKEPALQICLSVQEEGQIYADISKVEIPLRELAERLKPFLVDYDGKG